MIMLSGLKVVNTVIETCMCIDSLIHQNSRLEAILMKRIFVSYSRHNLDAVTQLIHDLNAVGVDTWHDQTLTGGQRWWDNILANIRECDIFIFALSPGAWESEACKSELDYVVQLGKPILPVLVADGPTQGISPPAIGGSGRTGARRYVVVGRERRNRTHHPVEGAKRIEL